MTTQEKIAKALAAIKQEQSKSTGNTNNNMINAFNNGRNEGLWMAEQYLLTWFADEITTTPVVEEKKANPYEGMSNDEMYHALTAQNTDFSTYMYGC